MKRASSLSVLNNAPLQQQQINRPSTAMNTMEQQNTALFKQRYPSSSSSSFRGRLTSAENLH